MSPALQRIQQAVQTAGERTPSAVLDAFVPEAPVVFGLQLHRFSLGTYLALEKLGHPFVIRGAGDQIQVSTHDIATALYVLTHSSAEVYQAIRNGTVLEAVLATAEAAEMSDLEAGTTALMAHIENALAPTLPMRAPSGSDQKKTVGLAGF